MDTNSRKNLEGYIYPDVVDWIISVEKNYADLGKLINVMYLNAEQNNNHIIYMSDDRLMEKTGWHEQKLIRRKQELEKLKIIKICWHRYENDELKPKKYIELQYRFTLNKNNFE